jgi:hypothetical protein
MTWDWEALVAYEQDLVAEASRKLAGVPGLRILGEGADRVSVLSVVLEGIHPTMPARCSIRWASPCGLATLRPAADASFRNRSHPPGLVRRLQHPDRDRRAGGRAWRARTVGMTSELDELYRIILDHNRESRNFRKLGRHHLRRGAQSAPRICTRSGSSWTGPISEVTFLGQGRAIPAAHR